MHKRNHSITIICMKIIKQTLEFTEWLDGLKDNVTRLRLTARLKKAKLGNLGDIKPVGEGVWEMREFFGAGREHGKRCNGWPS